MAKRKLFVDDSRTPPPKSKRIKFEELPPVNSIKDLIDIGNSSKYYKNINVLMLWDILPNLIELENMIGMKSVKESIFYQVIYYLQGMHLKNIDGDYLHCMITGASGCGKTSVAKILAKIYQNLGILSKNAKFTLAHRESFIGEFLGQTASKTKKLLTSCLGGVLFVDEIYALSSGKKDRDSYAKEAIDTITAFLSEHKNDFVFIGAGYRAEVEKCFFGMNEGLNRRFAWRHDIEIYNEGELSEILIKMIKENHWDLDISTEFLKSSILKNPDIFKNAGGSMELLFSKIKLVHSKRVFGKTDDVKFKITEEDINSAIEIVKKYSEKKPVVNYDYYT